ncbi:MAG: hypothetical protein J6M94_05405 [Prevotella sp.]|nr:hypothetical protein [Prevotella sp.]
MFRIPLFIGLPDGEVFAEHLTTPLTIDPTSHLCAVATQGSVASYPLR